MGPWLKARLFALGVVSLLFTTAHGARNATVDDNDSSIRYSGTWQSTTTPIDLNVGGLHRLSVDRKATAVFTFTGVAIYMMAPKWPYAVGARVSLDSGPMFSVDLEDYEGKNVNQVETIGSAVVFSRTGLSNTRHTLGISFPTDKDYLVVDAFVYTVLEDSDTTSSSPSPSPSTASPASTASTVEPSQTSAVAAKINVLPVALGGAFGGLGLALLILALIFFLRRRNQQSSQPYTDNSQIHPTAYIGSTYTRPGLKNNTSGYIVEPYQPASWATYAKDPAPISPIAHPYAVSSMYSTTRPTSDYSASANQPAVSTFDDPQTASQYQTSDSYETHPFALSATSDSGGTVGEVASKAPTGKKSRYNGHTNRDADNSYDEPPSYRYG